MLYPLLWMISSSFKPDELIFSQPDRAPDLVRSRRTTSTAGPRCRVSFTTFYLNSFVIAGLAVIGNLAACSLTAYAFARLDFRFKKLWFALMLGTLMLPYHVTLVPQYVLFLQLRLGEHLPAADRAEVPRRRRLLRLPDGAVLPRHPARDRRGRDHGRLRSLADLLEDHAAALHPGPRHRRDLLLHLDLRRLPRPADLPQRHAHLHRAAGARAPSSTPPAASRSTARSSPCRRCRSSRSSSSSSPSSA